MAKPVIRTRIVFLLVAGVAIYLTACTTKQPQPAGPSEGELAFLGHCAVCHGENGAGNGPLAAALEEESGTRPAHLDNRERLDSLGRDEIIRIVSVGGFHSGRSALMPPWAGQLDPAVISAIVDHVMTLPARKPVTPSATIEHYLAAPEGSAKDGRRLYVFYCSVCHGAEGRGDGAYADTLYARYDVRPRNLTSTEYFQSKTDEELFVTISLGSAHGGRSPFMPAWSVTLTPEQIKDLISYVRAISDTESQP